MTDDFAVKLADPGCKAVLGDEEGPDVILQQNRVAVCDMHDAHEIAKPFRVGASPCPNQHLTVQSGAERGSAVGGAYEGTTLQRLGNAGIGQSHRRARFRVFGMWVDLLR